MTKAFVDAVVDLLVALTVGPVAFSPGGCMGEQAHYRVSDKVALAAQKVKEQLPSDAEYLALKPDQDGKRP